MKTKIEHSSATNPNPVLSVAKDGTVLYSNKAGDPLLHEWGVEVGEKLPSSIGDLVKGVITRNSPEKIEVEAGKRVYLVVFHPLPEQERVNISGFDISDQKEVEGKLRESENKYRNIVETSVEGIWIFNSVSETTYVNEKMAEMLGYKPEEMIGRFIWDFAYEEDKDIFQIKLANRKQGIDEVYELKLIRKDGSPLWISVSAKGFFDDAGKFEGSVGMFTDITDRKRAEEALRESKARVESIFRSTPVGIGVVVDRIIKEANELLCEMTGYSMEELLGKSALKLYPTAEEYERVGLVKYGMIAKCGTGYVETRWQRKDGSVVDILLGSSPIVPGDLSGEITFTALDITERKRAEEALKKAYDSLENKVKERTLELEKAYNSLKESEKRLAEAQRIAHIGNWDNDLVIGKLYWSDELYRIFGLNPQEGITYDKFLSYVHPDDRDFVYNSTKKAFEGKIYATDYKIVRLDGEERIVHSEREIIFDERNNPVRMKGTIQDVTERKKAEEKLRESEEKYRNIVETANEGIGIIDNEFKITYVNKKAEDMFGYSTEEIIGKSMWDFISEESKPTIKMIMEKGWGLNESFEIKYIRKDFLPLWAHVNIKSLFDEDGKFMGLMSMLTDITKRKEAEATLKNIEIARKQEIHHRIKNNLQVISSLLDLQAEQFKGKKDIKESEVLEAFRESQDRVISMALIHEELHKSGEIDTLNFSQYIKELADNLLLTYRLGNDSISLSMDIEKDIFFDMDTAVPLGIIVNELVSNSLKHAFPGRDKGEIRIKLCREKSESDVSTLFTLTISDNGVGIPENLDIEDLDSLGLQLVTSLVNQLDGKLELKRDNGTEFTVRFMVTEKDNQGSVAKNLAVLPNQ